MYVIKINGYILHIMLFPSSPLSYQFLLFTSNSFEFNLKSVTITHTLE